MYYPPSESTTSYGEAGASRTGRGLRRPVRDATLMGPQGDNEASGSLEANSPSTTKRTKTGNNVSPFSSIQVYDLPGLTFLGNRPLHQANRKVSPVPCALQPLRVRETANDTCDPFTLTRPLTIAKAAEKCSQGRICEENIGRMILSARKCIGVK